MSEDITFCEDFAARGQRDWLRNVCHDLEAAIAQGHAIDIASNLSATAYEKLRQALADASIRF